MYVLVTDDSGYYKPPVDLRPRENWREPISDERRKELLAWHEGDDDPLPEQPGPGEPGWMGYGQRVFGPYQTYDEGKIAAITLPYECDYWVVEVEAL